MRHGIISMKTSKAHARYAVSGTVWRYGSAYDTQHWEIRSSKKPIRPQQEMWAHRSNVLHSVLVGGCDHEQLSRFLLCCQPAPSGSLHKKTHAFISRETGLIRCMNLAVIALPCRSCLGVVFNRTLRNETGWWSSAGTTAFADPSYSSIH